MQLPDPYSWIPAQRMLYMSRWVSQGAEARTFQTYVRFRSSYADWGPLEANIKAGCPSTPVMEDILYKYRFAKKYRHPTLDKTLTRQRMVGEARMLLRCLRGGVRVPGIRLLGESDSCLGLEFIKGTIVRHLIPAGTDAYLDPSSRSFDEKEPDKLAKNASLANLREDLTLEMILEQMGEEIAKMHLIDVIHGDLTTSNMMIRASNNELVLIDFGLAYHSALVEDKAVDLYVLERAFISTHTHSEPMVASVLASYAKHIGDGWGQIKKKLDEVRLRGRKRTMIG